MLTPLNGYPGRHASQKVAVCRFPQDDLAGTRPARWHIPWKRLDVQRL